MKQKTLKIYIPAVMILLFCGCNRDIVRPAGGDANDGNIINVGMDIEDAVELSVVTRAGEQQSQDAEKVSWLVQPLKQGLDITYGNINNGERKNKRVAILKLQPADGGTIGDSSYKIDANSEYAVYSFNYRADDGTESTAPAVWYDNGPHFFEGVHVPYRLRYVDNAFELETNDRTVHDKTGLAAVHNLTTDQHIDTATGTDNDLGNYTLLAHYLGMPANTQLSATVARIKLPFRHRLCRVLAYILIDPDLKTNGQPAKIKGYKNEETDPSKPFRDDPTTSSIRFCNVDVLGGVHDVYDSQHQLHTLTPTWAEKVRKVVPHFQEQIGEFHTKESGDKVWFEGSSNYGSAPAGTTTKTYTNVPVYDLIIRPTYTSASNVMYDEALGGLTKQQYAAKTNQIDFTVSLDNGLTYEKHVTIDLDANYQTIIYLRITHEGVDYNESGSEKWVENTNNDKWYGVDNQNGNTLSQTGSSWQRAFYNTHLGSGDEITDGGFYDEDTPGVDGTSGQYVSNATWIKNFAQAYKGGAHHGDYFVLANDITIDARSLPDDFVFTGHLDGFNTHGERRYSTITVTGTNTPWKEYVETTDYSISPLYDTKPNVSYPTEGDMTDPFVLPTLYIRSELKYDYYTEDECNEHNAELPGAVKEGDEKEAACPYTYEEYSDLDPKPYQVITEVEYEALGEIDVKVKVPAEYYTSAQEYNEAKGTSLTEEEFNNLSKEEKLKTAAQYYTYDDFIKLELTLDLFEKLPGSLKTKPAVLWTAADAKIHNAELDGAWIYGTSYRRTYYDYTEAENLTIQQVAVGEYYKKVSEDNYERYSLPVLYKVQDRCSGNALFAGLDGIYSTKQEDEEAAGRSIYNQPWSWEANVHKEGSYWLPYRDVSDPDESKHTGWRAEVLNLTVSGCSLFKADAVITGNVENCKDQSGIVANHTPAMPKYK